MYTVCVYTCMQVVYVISVSAKHTLLSRNNNIDKLRMKLYDIACHLQLASDGVTCKYTLTYYIVTHFHFLSLIHFLNYFLSIFTYSLALSSIH